MRVKVDHMGVKAPHREAFSVRLKTGLILLASCTPEQRCHGSIGVADVAKGQKAPLYYPFLSFLCPKLVQSH